MRRHNVRYFDDFIKQIRSEFSTKTPNRSELEVIGNELKTLCTEYVFDQNLYRFARPGEELMYDLCVDPKGGPSIYLVSDGAGVDTVPHEHQTWAIIIGIQGEEFNVFYKPAGRNSRIVTRTGECCIRNGDVLIMEAHEIHAINSCLGIHPTYHVHLYGCSLVSLPGFAFRCYTIKTGSPRN